MNPITRASAGAAGCLALLGLCALVGPRTAYPQEPNVQDVRVVNPAVDPVLAQVKGTVCIDPACNTVTVGNTLNNPVPVRVLNSPPGEPVQLVIEWSLAEGVIGDAINFYIVPVGRQFMLEHVSATAELPRRQKVTMELFAGGIFSSEPLPSHALVMQHQGTFLRRDPREIYHSSEEAGLRADGPTTLFLLPRRDNGEGAASGRVTVTGILVDR